MNYNIDAIEIPMDEVAAFCRRHHICRLALFGSVLREDFGPDSDVDVWVEFELGQVPWAFFAMEGALVRILGRTVDLNTSQFLSRYFREEIRTEAVVMYNTEWKVTRQWLEAIG